MPLKFAFSTLLGCVALSAVAPARPIDGIHPVIVGMSDPSPYAGEIVTVTISFSAPATSPGTIATSSTTPSNWFLFPQMEAYNTGDSSVSFVAIIDSAATGSIEIDAVLNGVDVSFSQMLSSGALIPSIVAASRF